MWSSWGKSSISLKLPHLLWYLTCTLKHPMFPYQVSFASLHTASRGNRRVMRLPKQWLSNNWSSVEKSSCAVVYVLFGCLLIVFVDCCWVLFKLLLLMLISCHHFCLRYLSNSYFFMFSFLVSVAFGSSCLLFLFPSQCPSLVFLFFPYHFCC